MSSKKEEGTAAGVAQPAVPRYTKAQFLAAQKSDLPKDVLAAVLDDNKTYTKAEAQEKAAAYLERKV